MGAIAITGGENQSSEKDEGSERITSGYKVFSFLEKLWNLGDGTHVRCRREEQNIL
jgi:hypothetical protein